MRTKNPKEMMIIIIDAHTHLADNRIYPEYWLEGIKSNIAKSMKDTNGVDLPDTFLNNIVQGSLRDYDCSKMIAQMDEIGIDKSIILLADFGYNRNDIKYSIEEIFRIHYEAVSRYPDRFFVFGGIDPRRGKSGVDLFEKGIKEYGFRGLKLYPPCGFELNDRSLFPLYEICNHYKIPVLAHIGASLPSMKSTFNYPCSVIEVAKIFKNMPLILGHAALLYYENSYQLPLEQDTIYLEVSGFQQIYDNKNQIISNINNLFRECPENILFGTDWPLFNSRKMCITFFQELGNIPEYQKELFFYENANRVLSMNQLNKL
jgi:Predicted metal-dependent hydrolase of the TIM-barrel fold